MAGAARDSIGVYVTGLGVLGLALLATTYGIVTKYDAADLLVLGAVGLGFAAALLGDVCGRLAGDVRPSWIAAALALYTLVVVPGTMLWPETHEGNLPGVVAARLVVLAVILALLLVALRPPVRLERWAPWLAAGAGALLSVAAAKVAAVIPTASAALAGLAALTAVVVVAWTATSAFVVVGALRRRDPTVWWMGLGFLLVSLAHAHRVATGVEFDQPDLLFGGIRLIGMLTVLVGTVQLVWGGVRAVRSENWELQEELCVAAMSMQRAGAKAAERDHELRNGIIGLSGMTQLLSGGGKEQEQLRAAVLHELARLSAMVECNGAADGTAAARGYDVTPVLADAVMLRRAAGARIELSSPQGLCAAGPPEVLAQVIGNLLGNCARHAPGAAVRVAAHAVEARVRVVVSDNGPGIAAGRERLVVERGVHDPANGGEGLGLHVSRELVEGLDGSLRVLPRTDAGGCTVVVELPRAEPGPSPPPTEPTACLFPEDLPGRSRRYDERRTPASAAAGRGPHRARRGRP